MKKFKGLFFYIFAIIGVFFALKLFMFYIPFLLGFLFSQILEPIIRFMMRKNISRKTSSIIVVFIFFIILVGILLFGGTFIISEISNLLSNFNEYINSVTGYINYLSKYVNLDKLNLNSEIKNIFESTSVDFINTIAKTIKSYLSNFMSGITSLPTIFIYIIITILATYFISSDKFYILDQMEYHFPKKWVAVTRENVRNIVGSLGSYLKAELIMILISFIIVLIGLNIFYFIGLDVKYPLLMAVIIGFVDSLPILGSGTVIIPWSVICFVNQDNALGFSLLGLYIFTVIVKQFIEPRIVSNNIGIHPIYTLISMYTGFRFLGILGLIAGPIILIILKNVFSGTIDRGFVKSVIDED